MAIDLAILREQIDDIDKQIVALYEKRIKLCEEVAQFKIETGKKVFDKMREEEKIQKVRELVTGDFNQSAIEELFKQIMATSRKKQYQLLEAQSVKNLHKKAVIFDLDGTLADTIASIKYCADYAIGTCGFPPIELKHYKTFIGDGAEELIRRALCYSGDVECVCFDKAFAQYKSFFKDNCMYQVKPYGGMKECLDRLKEAGVKLAVFSNKPHARTIDVVETLFGKGYFDEILGQGELVAKKPSPDGMHLLAEKLGVALEELAYVGDTNTDMITGKAAGVFTIGVLWGFRDREELERYEADVIVSHPLDILAQI